MEIWNSLIRNTLALKRWSFISIPIQARFFLFPTDIETFFAFVSSFQWVYRITYHTKFHQDKSSCLGKIVCLKSRAEIEHWIGFLFVVMIFMWIKFTLSIISKHSIQHFFCNLRKNVWSNGSNDFHVNEVHVIVFKSKHSNQHSFAIFI